MAQNSSREFGGSHQPTGDLPSGAILMFVILTFAITWGIGGAYIYFPDWMEPRFGELTGLHPLFVIGTWGPAIAGVILVLAFTGLKGLRAFLSRLLLWRTALHWWLLILFGLPLLFVIGSLIKGGGILAELPEEGLAVAFLITAVMLFLGPMEELGWRGVAQPLLQRFIAPFWVGILIGLVWGVWHLPAFFLAGVVHSSWDFATFLVGCMAAAVLVTPIFNRSKGSLLLPVLLHWQLNIPFWPDGQPWDTYILVGIAALVTWFYRGEMFSRSNAVVRVIPETT